MITIGLFACVAAFPHSQDYTVEYLPNGERVCRENCGRPFNNCPNIPCPRPDPPALDARCEEPSCNDATFWWVLRPCAEAEYLFWQCPGQGVWRPVQQHCACTTVFGYREQRCVHPHEWTRQCNAHQVNPRTERCIQCDTCGNEPTTNLPPITNPPITNPPITTQGPGGCPCICVPCIQWPCNPCPNSCCRSRAFDENIPLIVEN